MPKTREQKRQEADNRRTAYEERSVEDQLQLVKARPGSSAREMRKLLKNVMDQVAS